MKKLLKKTFVACCVVVSVIVVLFLLVFMAGSSGTAEMTDALSQKNINLMDNFDASLTNQLSSTMEGILSIEKVYWLNDDAQAPLPDKEKYGESADPSELGWLLDQAQKLLDGQETVFSTETIIAPGTKVSYYLDETILAITWKQVLDGGMYTFSEVKIKHPSQLRRYLAGGEYGSQIRLKTTQMAQTVNAVVASSGDFYDYRQHGVIVYDGVVRRVNSGWVDTCYIDENGNLLVTYAGQLRNREQAQKFVDDNHIRFSMAFGPVLVEKGEDVYIPEDYFLGQIEDSYPRAALCQKGELHYVVVVVNAEGEYRNTADLFSFAHRVRQLNVQTAYTIDGGQTAAIVMDGKLINAVLGGSQRNISDIFYFATAVPDGG